jgi:pimeloyl-ACP methyl ester carboxylesterase
MARFVLVHGAWHGRWCFAELVQELERRGHEASAPHLPCDDVTKDQYDYAAVLGDCSDAIVVGHSLGGQTIALVDAHVHIYLAAILPVENVFAHAFAEGFGGFARDDQGRSYWPDADTAAERLYPDCPRARADWAFPQLRPQSPFPAIARPFAARDVVIATTRDAAVDPAWQSRTGNAHGLRVIELDAGHSPFFTQPGELADVLSSLA